MKHPWSSAIPAMAPATLLGGIALPAQTLTPEENREANLETYADLLRQDIKTQEVAMLSQLMNLSPEPAAGASPGAISGAAAKGKSLVVPPETRLTPELRSPLPLN